MAKGKSYMQILERENDIVANLFTKFQTEDLFHENIVSKIYFAYEFKKPYAVWTGGLPLYSLMPFNTSYSDKYLVFIYTWLLKN